MSAGETLLGRVAERLAATGDALPLSPRAPRPVLLGGALLGGEAPLVAVALTGPAADDLAGQARDAVRAGADLLELRLDLLGTTSGERGGAEDLAAAWAGATQDLCRALGAVAGSEVVAAGTGGGTEGATAGTADALRAVGTGERVGTVATPVLLTARTTAEGGRADLAGEAYARALGRLVTLLGERARTDPTLRAVAALDVELATGALSGLARLAHEAGLAVVASSHDFSATPPPGELLRRLRAMEREGADAAKLAVTPRSPADVEILLEATARARAGLEVPVITMSMGETGLPTRLVGGIAGSALTFATAGGRPSAPGQPDVAEVRAALARTARG